MLKRAKWMASLVLFVIIAGSVASIVFQKSEPQNLLRASFNGKTEQKRSGVVKDIWHSDVHYRITAPRSTLVATPHGSRYEVVEKMEGIECMLQEKVDDTGQQVRYFKSDEGTYHFSNHEFLAEKVSMSLFSAEGKELPKAPSEETFMKGIAREVSLTLSGSHPNFHAQEFKAHINGTKGN